MFHPHKSDEPFLGLPLPQCPQILRMMLRQRKRVQQIQVERLDAVPHEPMRRRVLIPPVVIYTPRSHRLQGNNAQRMPGRSLHITKEMCFLVPHQRRKILAKPVGVFFHIRIYAQAQAGLLRLKRYMPLVDQSHFQGRLSLPRLIRQSTLHVIYHGTVRTPPVRHPFRYPGLSFRYGIKRRSGMSVTAEERHRVIARFPFKYQPFQASIGSDAGFPSLCVPSGTLSGHVHSP